MCAAENASAPSYILLLVEAYRCWFWLRAVLLAVWLMDLCREQMAARQAGRQQAGRQAVGIGLEVEEAPYALQRLQLAEATL